MVACLVLTLQTWFVLADGQLQDLLVATARGRASLQEFLGSTDWTKRSASLLSAKDEFGFSSLAVAAYNGDWQAAELLLKHGASVTSGDITVFMGEQAVKVGSIVEFIVRRSSMLIMLGTGRIAFERLFGQTCRVNLSKDSGFLRLCRAAWAVVQHVHHNPQDPSLDDFIVTQGSHVAGTPSINRGELGAIVWLAQFFRPIPSTRFYVCSHRFRFCISPCRRYH